MLCHSAVKLFVTNEDMPSDQHSNGLNEKYIVIILLEATADGCRELVPVCH